MLRANSGDPASGLDLHCLLMSHKKDARLIWVNRGSYMSAYTAFAFSHTKYESISLSMW